MHYFTTSILRSGDVVWDFGVSIHVTDTKISAAVLYDKVSNLWISG